MQLRQLEYFVAVAEERSFTRAASRSRVVQSAISAAVKALERELGTVLLDRSSQHVDLTDAGLVFLPRARAILDAAREARDAVTDVRGGLGGSLRIGTMTSMHLIDLPALLGDFHRRYPGVVLGITVAPSGTQGLVEALADRRLDLAFVSVPGLPPAGVRLHRLTTARIDLFVPADHPLARRRRVPIAALAGLDFIDFPVGYGNRAVVDRAFTVADITRHVTIEIADVGTGADYVRRGLGVALLPGFVAAGEGVAQLAVTGADLAWPLQVAVPADRTPSAAARALLALLPTS